MLGDIPWLDLLSIARRAAEDPDDLIALLRDELRLPVYSEYTPLRAVALALGNWADPSALPYLEAMAESGRPEVAGAARWSLRAMGA